MEMGEAVFNKGPFTAKFWPPAVSPPPPSSLKIMTPVEAGEYPVILFVHGFFLGNSLYSELLKHIASHGYILVAPQLFNRFGLPPCRLETQIKWAAEVADWICTGLRSSLPPDVSPDLDRLALAGHSRGGKNVFCLLLGYAQTMANFKCLVGIDPVAGSRSREIPPAILNKPGPFGIAVPVLVIGTGYGPEGKPSIIPSCPCAPKGLNHVEFYNKCNPPSYHVVADKYGHMDMLDDGFSIEGIIAHSACKKGEDLELMRRCVGGLVVAFCKSCLDKDDKALSDIYNDPSIAPTSITVEKK